MAQSIFQLCSEPLFVFAKSITLSHIFKAAGRCVTITTVLSVILRRFWSNRFSVSESSAEVASSSSSIGLSENIALAIAILCICPSDRPVPRSPSRVSIPPSSSDTKSSAQAICKALLIELLVLHTCTFQCYAYRTTNRVELRQPLEPFQVHSLHPCRIGRDSIHGAGEKID